MRVAIVLAAGASSRFGRSSKLLAPIGGRPLLAHAVARARASADRVIVVTGRHALRVAIVARAGGAEAVHAAGWRDGLSASLRAGIARLRPTDREVLLFLGDMPAVPVARHWRLGGAEAVRPVARDGLPGHPVLLRCRLLDGLPLSGDRGLAAALRGRRIRAVRAGAGAFLDVDRPRALAPARGSLRRAGALPRR